VVYLADYGLELARLLTAGVDLWLNTPLPPHEASGTSGMKAAHNGVPSLSVLDGWWLEGCVEGITGWAIGPPPDRQPPAEARDGEDAADLYRKLAEVILPTYRRDPDHWTEIMRSTIALNASHFNTQRMVEEYAVHAYQEPPAG
jgi:starch phosphorylase